MCAHSLTINKNRSAPNKNSANHFEVQSFEQSAKTIIKLLAGWGFFRVFRSSVRDGKKCKFVLMYERFGRNTIHSGVVLQLQYYYR